MKYVFFLMFSVFLFGLQAQMNQTDAKGKKQGPWQKTYPNSSVLIYQGSFKDDRPIGVFNYYFPDGALKAKIEHGLPGGKSAVQLYFDNGQVLSDGFYKQEKKDSLWFNYAQSGELMSAENYKNDLLNGKALYYYKEGQVLEHKLQVERRVQYLDGKLHGKYQSYFYNGKLKQEGSYERGLKQGLWSEYNSKGVLIGTMKYVNDFLHGWVITYDEAGQVLNKTLYLDGQKLSEKELTIYLSNCKARNIKPVE